MLTMLFNLGCLLVNGSIVPIFIFSGCAAMLATMFMVYGAMMMAEVTDESLHETGLVMNGTIAALKGFSNKLGIAISNGILSAVLAVTGYIPNAIGAEPEATVRGITLVRFGVPLLMAGIATMALIFYPITEELKASHRKSADKI